MGFAAAPPAATKVAATSSSAVSTSASSSRLKREDCLRTKHDSAFSKWQILIGPSDWKNYLQGREGAERYRVQNLPTKSGPGVYEIGVAVLITRSGGGRDVGKLEPDRIVVVYLGQAENVRARLQKYGRGGSHLETKYSLIGVTSGQIADNDDRGSGRDKYGGRGTATGLFMEVFSRGYPIVYRWAPLSSKNDAERTEAKLLSKFDYAWNKVSNGARRPNDVLHKIDKISSKTTRQLPRVIKWLQSLNEPKYGVPIKATKLADDKKLTSYDDSLEQQGHKEVTHVFKLGRWCRPRLIKSDKVGDSKDDRDLNYVSSLTWNDSSICMSADHDEMQKRYAERKGLSVSNNIWSRSFSDSLNSPSTVVLGSAHGLQDFSYDYKENISSNDKARRSVGEDHFSPICGVILLDGSPCRVQPSPGRKRCQDHKGQRIHRLVPNKSITEEGYLHQLDWLSETAADHKKSSNKESNLDETSEINNLRPDQLSASKRSPAYDDDNSAAICGVVLGHGEYCRRQPAAGRKRCEEHKGMRVNGYMSKLTSFNTFLRD